MEQDKQKHILLIEDDQTLSRLYRRILEENSFHVATTADGAEGFEFIKDHRPNLILLDIMLPKKDGLMVLRDLKSDESTQDIPVLIVSNLGQERVIDQAIKLGAVGYIVKAQISATELVDEVNSVIGG